MTCDAMQREKAIHEAAARRAARKCKGGGKSPPASSAGDFSSILRPDGEGLWCWIRGPNSSNGSAIESAVMMEAAVSAWIAFVLAEDRALAAINRGNQKH